MTTQDRRLTILPLEIAGWSARVQEGMCQLGWVADVLDISADPYGYGAVTPTERSLVWLREGYRRTARLGLVGRLVARPLLLPLRIAATWTLVRRRQALIYVFGRTLLWGLDVRLARALGRRTVAVFLGGDARPPWMDADHVNDDRAPTWPLVRLRTYVIARRVRAMERHTDAVVCHPSYAHFLQRPFVNWLAIGMPVDDDIGVRRNPDVDRAEVVVLHAPTRRLQKGSPEIEAAVDLLVSEGFPVRYETLAGLTTSEVRRRLAQADVVVDQLWSDTYFAGLSSEAGVAGALPLVFGYAGELLDPMADRLGVPHRHYAEPEALEGRLRRAVTEPRWRERVAAESARYLREACGPAHVAARLLRILEGDVPAAWWVDPSTVRYLDGYGMSRKQAMARLREYVARYGEAALCLPAGSAAVQAVHERLKTEPAEEMIRRCAD